MTTKGLHHQSQLLVFVPLWQQAVGRQVARLVHVLIVVGKLGLDGVGGQEHGGLGGAVVLVV